MRSAMDVVIVGGGLAGLTLALQLTRRRSDLAVVVVDDERRPVPERTWRVGESFSELGSYYLRDVVGLRDHLEERQLPKIGLRFFVGDAEDLADRFELGVLNPVLCHVDDGRIAGLPLRTHQVDRGRLENELARRCARAGVQLLDETRVSRSVLETDGHRLDLSNGRTIQARWVVFASGGAVPDRAGPRRRLGHRTRAAWFRVEGDLDVGTWSSQRDFLECTPPGFRRLSTNHLMGPGYWSWIIPLPSAATSVGVVADPEVADLAVRDPAELIGWIRVRDPRLAEELSRARVLEGDFHRADLEAGLATTCFSSDRWAVVGQAAAFTDVLYSPGADLIALGNTLLVDLIDHDMKGGRLSGRCVVANRVFGGFAEGLAEIYRGQYANFGTPEVVGTKVLWDSALYFGFNTMLFRHGLSGDARFLASIQPELLSLRSLQARIQGRLRSGDVTPLVPGGSATVEWGTVQWVMDAYYGAEAQRDPTHVVTQLRSVLSTLERIGRKVEGGP